MKSLLHLNKQYLKLQANPTYTHNASGVNPGTDDLEPDNILFLYDVVFLFALVTWGVHIWTELHISWDGLEYKFSLCVIIIHDLKTS